MDRDRGTDAVLPLYLVLDVSGSMSPFLPGIREALSNTLADLRSSPALAEVVAFGLITFSNDAQIVLPLSKIDSMVDIPNLLGGGGTRYGSAFKTVAMVLPGDIASLKAAHRRVYRPVVIFVTDGMPMDPDSLNDPWGSLGRLRPNVISLGINDGVDSATLLAVATRPDYALVHTGSEALFAHPGAIIANVIQSYTETLVSSVKANQSTAPLPLPPEVSVAE